MEHALVGITGEIDRHFFPSIMIHGETYFSFHVSKTQLLERGFNKQYWEFLKHFSLVDAFPSCKENAHLLERGKKYMQCTRLLGGHFRMINKKLYTCRGCTPC